jgi:hypothetical protein
MPYYYVTTRDVAVTKYHVKAETEEEALAKVAEFHDDAEEWDQYWEGAEVLNVEALTEEN